VSDWEHRREDLPPADPAGIDEPHDVLAAEEFGIGTRDERHPPDPTGIEDPHDVLAAEEFAMPAPGGAGSDFPEERDARAWIPLVALALLALLLLRRRR
jgi:MYXO-CTERM domain-containing protein